MRDVSELRNRIIKSPQYHFKPSKWIKRNGKELGRGEAHGKKKLLGKSYASACYFLTFSSFIFEHVTECNCIVEECEGICCQKRTTATDIMTHLPLIVCRLTCKREYSCSCCACQHLICNTIQTLIRASCACKHNQGLISKITLKSLLIHEL